MTSPRILRRTLQALPVAGDGVPADLPGHLLACLPAGADGTVLRFYFSPDLPPEALRPVGEGGVTWSRIVSGAPIVDVTAAGGRALLPLRGGPMARGGGPPHAGPR